MCRTAGPTGPANSAGGDLGAGCYHQRVVKLTLAGLEPAIFGSEDQRLIHGADAFARGCLIAIMPA